MSANDLTKLSPEDFALFEECLRRLHGSVEDGYAFLRHNVQLSFPRSRFVNSDDLVDDTITRVITKVVEFERRGEPITSLEAFARRVAAMIVHEYGRRKRKEVPLAADDTGVSDPAKRSEFRYRPEHELNAIVSETKYECMTTCIAKLSSRKRALLLSYYPAQFVRPDELADLRLKLAIKEGVGTTDEPPERLQRHLNNLQSEISKLRVKIRRCARKCLEKRLSGDINLAYLQEQDRRR
jgi:DNA-directed RNA polymerase specialized sigma24 family protein